MAFFDHQHERLWSGVDELFGEKGCFGFSRADVRVIEVCHKLALPLLRPTFALFTIFFFIAAAIATLLPILYFVTFRFDVTGVGMRMATTITCQSLTVTFLGKKCVLLCPCLFALLSSLLNLVCFQPGKPRKSEGWEKIYVVSFGAGALASFVRHIISLDLLFDN